jgi:hypothetical protein
MTLPLQYLPGEEQVPLKEDYYDEISRRLSVNCWRQENNISSIHLLSVIL